MNTKTLLSMHLTASEVDSVRESFSRFCHTPVDLKVFKAELCERSTSRNVITLVVISTATVVFDCRKCHNTFFFCFTIEAAKTKVREKHPCVLYTSFNGVLLKSSFWSPVWGSWRIYLLFFLSISRQKIRTFQPDRETCPSTSENRSFFCSHQHGEMFVITPANVHRAHSTPPCRLQYAQFTLCVKSTWVTLSSVTPLLSKQSFTLTAKPESPLLMLPLIVMGRS